MNETVIQTRDICKTYGKFSAVSNLNLQVSRGDIYALVGQNGAGKTTLLKLICGLTPASSGELEFFGYREERQIGRARSKMGCMIETPGFFPYLSAKENLECYRIQRGIKDAGCVDRALQFVGLADTGRKKFKNFSLGMKQRLGLALAVLNDPDLLILDEPINGLDPMGIKEFREILMKLNREKKTTVLISSHILGELSQIATVYGFIRGGELMEHLSAQELQEKCRKYLLLNVDDAQKAAAVLKNQPGCAFSVEDQNTLHVRQGYEKPELLVQALVKNGVMVSQVYRSGMNLEQYFVSLMEGKKHA
jgi:ABC-2 type transport system ATP-binding protein